MAADDNTTDDSTKRGRPSAYKAEFIEQARKLCQLGATDREIADFFNIGFRTLGDWKARHPEFFEAMKVGKEAADDRVERSLYQLAVGYSFENQKVFMHEGVPVVVDYIETLPPNSTACIYWTKNRRPDKWRDRRENAVTINRDPAEMSDDDLAAIAAGRGEPVAPSPSDTKKPH